MAREFNRTDRVGAQMQRELAELVRTELQNPELGMITIQEVRVVRDFSHAKVFFTAFGGDMTPREIQKELKKAAGFLRHELAHRMNLRTMPELHFVHDESIEQGAKLSALIEKAVDEDRKHTKDQE